MARIHSSSAVPGIDSIVLGTQLTLGEPCVRLRELVRASLERGAAVLIDAAAVTQIDSSGLGELVACWNMMAERGMALKLVRPSARVVLMLQTAKLDGTFETFDDEASALSSFSARQ